MGTAVGGFETTDGGKSWTPSSIAPKANKIRTRAADGTPMIYAIGSEVQLHPYPGTSILRSQNLVESRIFANRTLTDVRRILRVEDDDSPSSASFVRRSLRHSRHWLRAFGVLPQNRIQFLRIDRIGTRKVHL